MSKKLLSALLTLGLVLVVPAFAQEDYESQLEQDVEQGVAEVEQEAEEVSAEVESELDETSAEIESEFDEDLDADAEAMDDELPQTGSELPLLGLMGLLSLGGALALRQARS